MSKNIEWTDELKDSLYECWERGLTSKESAVEMDISLHALRSAANKFGLGKFGEKQNKSGKLRKCMCCRNEFFSSHNGNRLCEFCSEKAGNMVLI